MMRNEGEISERYLQIKSLVALKHELSAADAEDGETGEEVMTLNRDNIGNIRKFLHPDWQDIHRDLKANTPPEQHYDMGVKIGQIQILEWVLGGDDD